ncbi:hypothetical protein TREMEDRAFT_57986, partial [Tremella mesenterica DSM 1558]|uniref:uncharacterized protein n=1 Tax=Tremella mesenterica (strain ATCC 24925 / CBS 8224 / DSM 1558 / NBRC 9311 / NRRL Y-6157 / RJB 2259-6 / UBC 559-6) TaxID=578456 RepID=UPI00032BB33C
MTRNQPAGVLERTFYVIGTGSTGRPDWGFMVRNLWNRIYIEIKPTAVLSDDLVEFVIHVIKMGSLVWNTVSLQVETGVEFEGLDVSMWEDAKTILKQVYL